MARVRVSTQVTCSASSVEGPAFRVQGPRSWLRVEITGPCWSLLFKAGGLDQDTE